MDSKADNFNRVGVPCEAFEVPVGIRIESRRATANIG